MSINYAGRCAVAIEAISFIKLCFFAGRAFELAFPFNDSEGMDEEAKGGFS